MIQNFYILAQPGSLFITWFFNFPSRNWLTLAHRSTSITPRFGKISAFSYPSDILPGYFQSIHGYILLSPSIMLFNNTWIPHVILSEGSPFVRMEARVIIRSVHWDYCFTLVLSVAHSLHLVYRHFTTLSEVLTAILPTTPIIHVTVEVLEAWLVIRLEVKLMAFQMDCVPDPTITPVLAQICWLGSQILILITSVIYPIQIPVVVRTRRLYGHLLLLVSVEHIGSTHIILEDIQPHILNITSSYLADL